MFSLANNKKYILWLVMSKKEVYVISLYNCTNTWNDTYSAISTVTRKIIFDNVINN